MDNKVTLYYACVKHSLYGNVRRAMSQEEALASSVDEFGREWLFETGPFADIEDAQKAVNKNVVREVTG